MKRSYYGVLQLSLVLFCNIIFTQLAVHQFYYQHYGKTILFAALNIILFPVALLIYQKEKQVR